MEIFKFNILPDDEFNKRETFKMALLNCQLCGGELHFLHNKEAQAALPVVHEEAHCPSCQIQLQKKTHGLH